MANTIAPEAFTETRNGYFQEKITTATVASDICNVHRNKYQEYIRTPYRSDVVVSTNTGRISEADVSDFTVTDDFVKLEDAIYVAEHINPSNEAYTAADLTKESMNEMNRGLLEAIDKKVFTDALATTGIATTTATAITDAATAKTATEEIVGALAGYGGKLSDRFIVMDNDTFVHFLDAGATPATSFGDRVLETGDLYVYMGLYIYVVRSGQIAAGEILAGVKGAIDLYIDEVGIRTEELQATASAANKVNLEKVRVALVYVAVKIWEQKKKAVVKLA